MCSELRKASRVPILFLTAADEETDIIRGLDLGGDDYITKPFKLAILLSRINAVLRRNEEFSAQKPELSSNGISINMLSGTASKGGQTVELTAGEFRLLRLFMENPAQILSPEQILAKLWDCDERFVDGNTLSVYIRRLRIKIEDDPSNPSKIVTIRGMGYKWNTGDGK